MTVPFEVQVSVGLLEHLREFEVDGATVADAFFSGGRLWYPGRTDIEQLTGKTDPYTLEHEARIMLGELPGTDILYLSNFATENLADEVPGLDVLWRSHQAYRRIGEGPSLDRLVSSLVTVHMLSEGIWRPRTSGVNTDSWKALNDAAEGLVAWLHSIGLPPTQEGLEEIFDGAFPACVGLGIVEI